MKDIYSALLSFIESTEDCDNEFKTLKNIIDKQAILEEKEGIKMLFKLISKIADNHYRPSDFISKIEKVIRYLQQNKSTKINDYINISDYDIFNKRILFLLFEKELLKPDQSYITAYLQKKPKNIHEHLFSKEKKEDFQRYYYLYPSLKRYLDQKTQNQIEGEILQLFDADFTQFYEKCQKGENDSYICTLIRSDSIEDFISHVNRTNTSLQTKIKPTIYETNNFLIEKEPTLIEYASFYGSIQIVRYLKYNGVPLDFSLWKYAVHSNNAELIHYLEECNVFPSHSNSFNKILQESIKCHHNEISNYIKDMHLNENNNKDNSEIIANSFNFLFMPDDINSIFSNPKNKKGFNLTLLCLVFTSIKLPPIISLINDNAFEEFSLLTQVVIPSSVTKIGKYAFYRCKSLESVTLSSSLKTINEGTFFECSSLSQITISSSLTSIGDYAFYHCSSLDQLSIPSSLISIGNSSFDGCSSLTKIVIPSSVTSIGNSAFKECLSLIQIEIHSSLSSIKYDTFAGCSSLKQIPIPSSVNLIEYSAFSRCSALIQISIPSSVTEIGDYAFYQCSSLKMLEIPSSVKSIGNYAFRKCSSLTQISIPASTSIGVDAFIECPHLKVK